MCVVAGNDKVDEGGVRYGMCVCCVHARVYARGTKGAICVTRSSRQATVAVVAST